MTRLLLTAPLALALACAASPKQAELEHRMAELESRIADDDRELDKLRLDVARIKATSSDSDAELERVREQTVALRNKAADDSRELERLEARRKALEVELESRRAPTHEQLVRLSRTARRLIGKVTPRRDRNRLIHDLLAIDLAGTDIDVRKRYRAYRGLSSLIARVRDARAESAATSHAAYRRLYQKVGRQLDKSALPVNHKLVRLYIDIQFQAALMNADLRRKYVRRLHRIAREVPVAGSAPTAAAGPPGKTRAVPSEIQRFQNLYRETGTLLDSLDLGPGHQLVKDYLSINYQSGVLHDAVRKGYLRQLHAIQQAVDRGDI